EEEGQTAAVERADGQGQGAKARPRPRVPQGDPGFLLEKGLHLSAGEPVEQEVEALRAEGRSVLLRSGAILHQGSHPRLEEGVPMRSQVAGRALESRDEVFHRGLSPRCRYAIPPVRGSHATAVKPAFSMSAPKAGGEGKAATEAGR